MRHLSKGGAKAKEADVAVESVERGAAIFSVFGVPFLAVWRGVKFRARALFAWLVVIAVAA